MVPVAEEWVGASNAESKRCRVPGGKVAIVIIGGMFLCFGTSITFVVMIGTIKAALPIYASFLGVFVGGLGGWLGFIMLTRMPYEMVSNDQGINMMFLWRSERISWDQVEWYKVVVLVGSIGVGLWTVLKYQQSTKEKICYRKSVIPLQSMVPFEGFSSENYTSVFDKYVPHKRIRKWRYVFQ